MRILLTNDDGVQAPGIKALCQSLKDIGEIYVVAPATEQSGKSQAITVHNPIMVDKYDIGIDGVCVWSVGGTPADCVKLAIESLIPHKPDVVISGINCGANLGNDVLYSGTVGAAIEGAMQGIPSVAISLDERIEPDFELSAQIMKNFLEQHLEIMHMSARTVLNINIPARVALNAKVLLTKLGCRAYENDFEKRINPSGKSYYWMCGNIVDKIEENTDVWAIERSCVSITPLHFDLTDYKLLQKLEQCSINFSKNAKN